MRAARLATSAAGLELDVSLDATKCPSRSLKQTRSDSRPRKCKPPLQSRSSAAAGSLVESAGQSGAARDSQLKPPVAGIGM